MTKNIGFVSTRFAGTDGVSLESSKWVDVFEQNGYRCFWFAGELDHEPAKTVLVPEAHFRHAQVQWINSQVFGKKGRTPTVTHAIHDMRSLLKSRLHDFVNQFDIDLLGGQPGTLNPEPLNLYNWRPIMPFVTIPGLKGKVYVPQAPDGCSKKHPCQDCFCCQNCSDDRCRVCLSQRNCRCKIYSVQK